ncbi:hypothetical protein DH2020_002761 [Rehmannia glutinosa]|uniref:SURP and G-patch domain-containing protein 1-like protein n=1 Tax=Rehmannia glutinosa TaxID=99300 RepID=A0ABR0XV82_REHGL
MDKATDHSIFVNDGSFMERFKQLQQEEQKSLLDKSRSGSSTFVTSTPKTVISKTTIEFKANGSRRTTQAPSSGKLAFSLKQKSKLITPPVKFGEDEDQDDKDAGNSSDDGPMKRPKLSQLDASDRSSKQVDVAPPSPSDPTMRKVADKLASFVAKNGRHFEHVTRQKNPGDTPFKFLFDESCSDYKYYEYRLSQEEKALSQTRDSQISQTGESSGPTGSDPIAMMEYYMKKAAQEEKRRPHRASKDEMPPPPSLQEFQFFLTLWLTSSYNAWYSSEKGHHMGDYIPPEELEKFLATCSDVSTQKAMRSTQIKTKIQADNVGHRLLSKMGWREGEGLGSSKSGIAAPIMAGDVKKDHLGVGAHAPGGYS